MNNVNALAFAMEYPEIAEHFTGLGERGQKKLDREICKETAAVYGSLAEGASEPEFNAYLQREAACQQCVKQIDKGQSEVKIKTV